MTDYIPNDPDCPRCGGSGRQRRPYPAVIAFGFRDCHCQHPKIVIAVWARELAGDLAAAGEAEYGADYGAAK